MEFVKIPAGSFQMGSDDPVWSYSCEQPVHTVSIGYDFYMSKYEVTQAQWTVLMGSNPAQDYGVGDDYPVYYVSWNDIRGESGFLDNLNALGQGTFRLPSEAEWEYACRAGTTTRFFFGDSDGGLGCEDAAAGVLPGNRTDYMWYCGNNGIPDVGSKPVGTKLPNQFGLFDMSGNVWELCEDDWHESYDSAMRPDDGSEWVDIPRGPLRTFRGGPWDQGAQMCRSAFRSFYGAAERHEYIGFRLLREAPIVTDTPTDTPTDMPTETQTFTPSNTPTVTPTSTESSTPTDTPTATPTSTPVDEPPSAPSGFRAIAGGDNITLEWDANTEPDVDGYNVYRGETDVGPFGKLNGTPLKGTRYVDGGKQIGQRFCYQVTAVDKAALEGLPAGPLCADVGQLRAWTPDVFGKPGETIRIPVNISNAYGVMDHGLSINFDTVSCAMAGLIEFVTWERTGLTPNYIYESNEPTPGDVRLMTVSSSGFVLAGEGHIVDLIYRVLPDAPDDSSCNFGFEHFSLYTLDDLKLPVPVGVDFTDTSVLQIRSDGKYRLGDIFPLCYNNGPDGRVDAGDVLLALAIAVGRIDPSVCPHMMDAGDVNGDGIIDAADVILITRISVGKPVNPPSTAKSMAKRSTFLAAAPEEYVVRVPFVGLTKKGTVDVPIRIDNAYGISGADIQLNYNQFVVEPVSMRAGDLAQDFRLESNLGETAPGVVRVSVARQNDLPSGGGVLGVVEFRAVNNAGNGSWTPVAIAKVKLARQYGENAAWDATVSAVNGRICIAPPYDINGDGQTTVEDIFLFSRQWLAPFGASNLLDFEKELGQ